MRFYRLLALLINVLIYPLCAQAQEVPFLGCFVQDNNQCADVEIQCTSNARDNYAAFDVAVGRLCDEVILRNATITDLQELANETAGVISKLERSYSIVSRRVVLLQRQKARSDQRILRLLRTCGTACRGL